MFSSFSKAPLVLVTCMIANYTYTKVAAGGPLLVVADVLSALGDAGLDPAGSFVTPAN